MIIDLGTKSRIIDILSLSKSIPVVHRCISTLEADAALSRECLSCQLEIHTFYDGLRDRLAPVKPLWLRETADAACGGNAWAATFLDTLRSLYQAASLAMRPRP